MKIARIVFPHNVKAQRKLIDSLAIAYGVKRKFLEPRIEYTMRVWNIAKKAMAMDMCVDNVSLISLPRAPLSMYVYEVEKGKRSQLFPPWE